MITSEQVQALLVGGSDQGSRISDEKVTKDILKVFRVSNDVRPATLDTLLDVDIDTCSDITPRVQLAARTIVITDAQTRQTLVRLDRSPCQYEAEMGQGNSKQKISVQDRPVLVTSSTAQLADNIAELYLT